ncbi:MAG: hypothetical protein Ta2G_21900 [Termitinemataceae bacterium]|nr:MAG: hypothetical protein Ta2G_21900 [Termitinemataceae bacterium]
MAAHNVKYRVLIFSIAQTLFFGVFLVAMLSVIFYFVGTALEWTDQIQVFLLNTMMRFGIIMLIFGIISIITLVIYKNKMKKKLFFSRLYTSILCCLLGVILPVFSGLIITIL